MENLLRKNNIIFHEKERKIKSIIKELSNHKYMVCNKQNPEYISLNNAVTLKELQYLCFGGNKRI